MFLGAYTKGYCVWHEAAKRTKLAVLSRKDAPQTPFGKCIIFQINIGIVLFGTAKVMDRLHYTAKTLPRLCRTDMMLQIDMEERIDAVREEMKEALMQGGGYKDAMDL